MNVNTTTTSVIADQDQRETLKVVRSDVIRVLNPEINLELLSHIRLWCEEFPKEETWAQTLGVPSLFLRVDAIIKNHLHILKINGNPTGMGILKESRPGLHEAIERCGWPLFKVLNLTGGDNRDDNLWRTSINSVSDLDSIKISDPTEAPLPVRDDLLLIRGGQKSKETDRFLHQSIATVKEHRYSRAEVLDEEMLITLPIYRLFFLYNLGGQNYEYFGGFWRQRRIENKVIKGELAQEWAEVGLVW